MKNTVVLIPHYNNLDCLVRTLQSICHTKGIDVLVVDDGSDKSMLPDFSTLQKELNENVSLEVLKVGKNKGITKALNIGLDHILKNKKHQFIARIDCGDVCVSNRFEIQEDFLFKNEGIALVGSWVKWIDNKGKVVFCKKPPLKHQEIKKRIHESNSEPDDVAQNDLLRTKIRLRSDLTNPEVKNFGNRNNKYNASTSTTSERMRKMILTMKV